MRQTIRVIYTLSHPTHLQTFAEATRLQVILRQSYLARAPLCSSPSVNATRDAFIAGTRPRVTDRASSLLG